MSDSNTHELFEKLNEFIKKYYLNQLIKGAIYVISVLLIFFLLFTIIEHFSSFDVGGRTFLFWSYLFINILIFIKLIIIPLLHLFKFGKSIGHKDAAKIIGKHFPEIDDKIINLLELSEISNKDNVLITASIIQKTKKLSSISFKSAIDLSLNKKHLKWVFIPIFIVLIFILSGKDHILTESSARIIKHNTFFEPKAPFDYIILNDDLTCKQFDDFLLQLRVEGDQIPNEIFIVSKENTFKLNKLKDNTFEYQFLRIHSDITFQFSGGGYLSKNHTIKSLSQPKVVHMEINIVPPKYTKKEQEKIKKNGDIIIHEGAVVNWDIQLENSNNNKFILASKTIKTSSKNNLNVKTQIFKNTNYSIITSNNNNLSDSLSYFIKVVPDKFPEINLSQSYDTANNLNLFSGVIEDDYLLNKLEFIYSYNTNDSLIVEAEEIVIYKKKLEQFLYVFNFNDLNVPPGKELHYYFKVWDNDGINGSKFTKSKIFTYKEPSVEELIKNKDLENEKTKLGLSKSISLAEEIQKDVDKLNKAILEKKNLGWEEKQKAKAILKKQKELEKTILDTQKKNSKNLNTKEKLNSSIVEKQQQLEKLMNNVLDEEMKNLLREMEQIINTADKEKLKALLEKLDRKNIDLEKELDRELELFKHLELEQKIEEVLDKISELKKEQKNLKKETLEGKKEKSSLFEKQKELNKKMDDIKKELEDIREKNMALEEKKEMPKTQKLENEIQESMHKSQTSLQKGMKKKSAKAQKDVIDQISELEKKLNDLQESSSESKPIEDMETLRKILENLITLSFDQENLMKHTYNTPRNSSVFVKIVQDQNKLSDNSKIIEDSLFALSKRVVQIQATINQEITSIKTNMSKTTKELEARNINKATERQQFIMTSVNNLALLLSEILEQMQKQLEMPPSNCNKPKNCNKPNPNCQKPSMSELKKAQKKLNQKMKAKKSGKTKNRGEKESKELMNLAKEQEQIRNHLMEIRDEIGKNGEKGNIDKIIKDMEESETDIINDKITQETLNRQKDILTKLLNAKDSEREQGKDNTRESTEWEFEIKNSSKEMLKYQRKQKTQEELLKTTPLQLTPFYKNKVTNYFNILIND